jgi:hypothetical protein
MFANVWTVEGMATAENIKQWKAKFNAEQAAVRLC